MTWIFEFFFAENCIRMPYMPSSRIHYFSIYAWLNFVHYIGISMVQPVFGSSDVISDISWNSITQERKENLRYGFLCSYTFSENFWIFWDEEMPGFAIYSKLWVILKTTLLHPGALSQETLAYNLWQKITLLL